MKLRKNLATLIGCFVRLSAISTFYVFSIFTMGPLGRNFCAIFCRIFVVKNFLRKNTSYLVKPFFFNDWLTTTRTKTARIFSTKFWYWRIFSKNGPSSALFLFIFVLFQTNNTFTTNNVKKMSTNIGCWDLNPRPSDCESHPTTTRPGVNLIKPLQ